MTGISFDARQCSDPAFSLQREWLETNGLGGFASSTIWGLNTRRYHGLLVAATKPPVGRMVLLSKLEETLVVGDHRYQLSANQYPDVIHPDGYRYLIGFRLDPFPVFTYRCEDIVIEKSLFMVHGDHAVVVEYRMLTASDSLTLPLSLEVRPLIAYRDFHSLTHANPYLNPTIEGDDRHVKLTPYEGCPTLYLVHNGALTPEPGLWYVRFQYEQERQRGLDWEEDLYNPCALLFDLQLGPATLIASTQPCETSMCADLRAREIQRRNTLGISSPADTDLIHMLTLAADQFVVRRGENHSLIAGYHWFGDWGRDTMIALPGLAIATGRYDIARDILKEFARHVDRGMLPNQFPDAGTSPEYNTVDATLWYFEAVRALLEATHDYQFVKENLYDVLRDIVRWHQTGTRYGIKVDSDGLLRAGEPGVQLTWMDARIGDWVVTPRTGKPVEIQALWYNALRVMQALATEFGDSAQARDYAALADLAKTSFNRLFWNNTAGCLYDVITPNGPDASIRPNQVFAVSLTHSMLSPSRAKQVITIIKKTLLTPLGLRTLEPHDPAYRPRYEGDAYSRDSGYHQGTVWPWLLGPFVEAYLTVYGRGKKRIEEATRMLAPIESHIRDAGLGQVSEICDAESPFAPKGCIAQAWSVGELLRVARLVRAAEQAYAGAPEVRPPQAMSLTNRT